MHSEILSTSFGRRALSHAQISTQQAVRRLNSEVSEDKWLAFRKLRAAAPALGLTDRSLTIVNALLSFYPDRTLRSGPALVVFPSNTTLADRANGISPATLRRHLALLVEAGIIIRRDSPNGKRYARRSAGGKLDYAYGFDLSPLIARQAEFHALAEKAKAERETKRRLREQITTTRRGLAKGIVFLSACERHDAAARFQDAYADLSGKLSPRLGIDDARAILHAFSALLSDLDKLLEKLTNVEILSASEPQNERHIEDQTPEYKTKTDLQIDRRPHRLADSLKNLPNFSKDILSGLRPAPDSLVRASDIAARLLAIPTATLNASRIKLGSRNTALAIAVLYEMGENITNPSAYLTLITKKIENGQTTIDDFLVSSHFRRTYLSEAEKLAENTSPVLKISTQLSQSLSAGRSRFLRNRA
ncbi:hypothetical protein FJU08_15390 [Martelella alba]|uniref:Plasmid replication protein C N-terminal domain-containing protein n=1 Tax=Martelella alba TaxID=2590451 RepID=A0A506U4F1_9HYPH|nr:plasmid replication protein RepC [Martelella alba]TPW29232.1 hypothetical protein FJU08_15390 [Martelella alba]